MAEPVSPPKDPLTEPAPWNAVAQAYDEEFVTRQLSGFVDRAVQILDLGAESTVLDLATGPGTFALRAAPRFERIIAVDFAEQMIARLYAHLQKDAIRNVEARVMDGLALTLPDGSFDGVVSMFGWFMFSDRARSLAEIHRVLRPRGRVLVTSWATPDRNTLLGTALEAVRHVLPDLPRPSGPLPTQVPETCASEVRDAGFTNVRTTLVASEVEYESVAEYWRTTERAGAPFVPLRKKLGEEKFANVTQKAREYLLEKLGSGKVTLVAEAIFTSATRT